MSARHETDVLELSDALKERVGRLGEDGAPPSRDELVAEGDAEGLLDLAAARLEGAPFADRDLEAALDCLESAASLGHPDARFLFGVARFSGIGGPADRSAGAAQIRDAAQAGSSRARLYVANLYEMGVHYAADREKADVWYRSAARAVGLEEDPDDPAFVISMAELGSVRHALKLVADGALPAKDRAFYLHKGKAMGYGHRLRQAQEEREAPIAAADPPEPAVEPADVEAAEPGRDEKVAKGDAKAAPETKPKKGDEASDGEDEEIPLGSTWTFGSGALAFAAALTFTAAGMAAGFLAAEGWRALSLAGRLPSAWPAVHSSVVGGAVFVLSGLAPAAATYRIRVLGIALCGGAVGAAAGYFLWPSQPWLWDAPAQAAAAGASLFLALLFFLGVLGGSRLR